MTIVEKLTIFSKLDSETCPKGKKCKIKYLGL